MITRRFWGTYHAGPPKGRYCHGKLSTLLLTSRRERGADEYTAISLRLSQSSESHGRSSIEDRGMEDINPFRLPNSPCPGPQLPLPEERWSGHHRHLYHHHISDNASFLRTESIQFISFQFVKSYLGMKQHCYKPCKSLTS